MDSCVPIRFGRKLVEVVQQFSERGYGGQLLLDIGGVCS
jgi:hypothetical protein